MKRREGSVANGCSIVTSRDLLWFAVVVFPLRSPENGSKQPPRDYRFSGSCITVVMTDSVR